jgi:hypothetical protein
MADTIREKIIAAIVATLDTYTGFTTIVSPSVERGYENYDPDVDALPIIAVMPRQENIEHTEYQTHACTMQVDIYCLIKIGAANPSALAEAVLGELIKATLSATPTEASDMAYINGGIDQYMDLSKTVLVVGISIEVKYETDIGDPYNCFDGSYEAGVEEVIGFNEETGGAV